MGFNFSDPASWVDKYADYLFRYAVLRVGEESVAEDLVQETFLAALRAKGNFQARSSERTWLTSILKHKILDYYRSKHRERTDPVNRMDFPLMENLFSKNGQWNIRPKDWKDDPLSSYEKKQFWKIFLKCLHQMSDRLRDIFILREFEGLDTGEICKELGITPTNCWVALYRARTYMRRCLEELWFASGRQKEE